VAMTKVQSNLCMFISKDKKIPALGPGLKDTGRSVSNLRS